MPRSVRQPGRTFGSTELSQEFCLQARAVHLGLGENSLESFLAHLGGLPSAAAAERDWATAE